MHESTEKWTNKYQVFEARNISVELMYRQPPHIRDVRVAYSPNSRSRWALRSPWLQYKGDPKSEIIVVQVIFTLSSLILLREKKRLDSRLKERNVTAFLSRHLRYCFQWRRAELLNRRFCFWSGVKHETVITWTSFQTPCRRIKTYSLYSENNFDQESTRKINSQSAKKKWFRRPQQTHYRLIFHR